MKKVIVMSLVLVIAAFSLGSVSKVYAQAEAPITTSNQNFGTGNGLMGANQQGLLHDEMVEVVAEKLGLTVEDLTTSLTNGETLYSVAIAEGLSNDEAKAMLKEARLQAIDLAVTNGDLTQAQADKMKTRISKMSADGASGVRGMMGGNRGANGSGTCIGVYQNN